MASVRLQNLSQTFDRTTAIQDISFEIPDGEFWVLVGPSGCGKSTILRSIAGLVPITSGEVFIGEVCVNQLPARQRDVAMVFQNYALYPHMSVAQNLAFGLEMRQTPTADVRDRVAQAAQMLSIEPLLERLPGQLSGGQQQRVALGRAIVRQPQVFLLDEPLSNLDAKLRAEMRAEIKLLHQQVGITTVYVTHDRTEAMTLADRIVMLSQGQIQQIGTPAEIYTQPLNRTVATFIGDPPMNILPVSHRGGQLWVGSRSLPCDRAVSDIPFQHHCGLELGLRAEALQLTAPDAGQLVARVELIEPLGRETLLRVSLLDTELSQLSNSPTTSPTTSNGTTVSPSVGAGHTLSLVTTAPVVCGLGETVGLTFDTAQVFLFEAESGHCLYAPIA